MVAACFGVKNYISSALKQSGEVVWEDVLVIVTMVLLTILLAPIFAPCMVFTALDKRGFWDRPVYRRKRPD